MTIYRHSLLLHPLLSENICKSQAVSFWRALKPFVYSRAELQLRTFFKGLSRLYPL